MSGRWRRCWRIRTVAVAAVVVVAVLPGLGAGAAEEATMTTAAGGGDGYTGDGGPADEAGLKGPRMIAFDPEGGYYIADTYHHVIRHVDTAGVITTYAGTGRAGHRDGPAEEARFHAPHSVDVDDDGNLIVGDPVNDRVRWIDAETKQVSTLAGIGKPGYSGDGGRANRAELDDSKIAIFGPDDAIYIADYGNSVVRRVDPHSKLITTFAGSGDPDSGHGDGRPAGEAFFKPRNITFDADGDLLVADRESNTIRSVDATTGVITTIAGNGEEGDDGDGGPAIEAQLNKPRGLGVDWMGNVYIADSINHRVRKIDAQTGVITTVAGTGESGRGGDGAPPDEAELQNPRHATFDDAGNLYITDTGSSRIRKVENFVPPPPSTTTTTTTTTDDSRTPTRRQGGTVERASGYWMLGSDGAVHPFGDAADHGEAPLASAADLEPSPSGDGYWVVAASGRVVAFGDAAHHGDAAAAGLAPDEAVTSVSATPTGAGYWLFTNRGRVLAHGDAEHLGDMFGTALNAAVLDSSATPSGRGYYMVATDGGIFSFGDAAFLGSMGDQALNEPVQALVPDPDSSGYWLVAADGGVFAFDAPFRGSMGSVALNRPVTGMVAFGDGYLMVGADGGIFNFSDRDFHGSLGGDPPAVPIVAVAALR